MYFFSFFNLSIYWLMIKKKCEWKWRIGTAIAVLPFSPLAWHKVRHFRNFDIDIVSLKLWTLESLIYRTFQVLKHLNLEINKANDQQLLTNQSSTNLRMANQWFAYFARRSTRGYYREYLLYYIPLWQATISNEYWTANKKIDDY